MKILTIVLILLSSLLGIVVYDMAKETKIKTKDRTLKYILNNNTYLITELNNNFKINEKTITEEDCEYLKSLFDEIFKDTNITEKSIDEKDLSSKQKEKIKEIFEDNDIISDLEYEIMKLDEHQKLYNYSYTEKGYSFIKEEESVIYTISMGQQPHSGFSIDVSKVEIIDNSATIYVEEQIPKEGEGISFLTVLQYPIAQVKFNKLPSKISVVNSKTGKNYPEIKI